MSVEVKFKCNICATEFVLTSTNKGKIPTGWGCVRPVLRVQLLKWPDKDKDQNAYQVHSAYRRVLRRARILNYCSELLRRSISVPFCASTAAAFTSACATYPHAVHLNASLLTRLHLSMWPHCAQV